MRILLAGTRSFGRAVLEDLDETRPMGDVVAAVVAPPDDPTSGLAQDRRLPLTDRCTPDFVRDHGIDLIVAAHSHAFIGEKSRRASTHGAIGYHPSLLPRHRGKDAVRWTIHMGDPIAGGSVYWFTNHIDGGPIAAQDWCHVRPGWDHHDLWRNELFPMGVRLLADVVDQVGWNDSKRVPQDERVATWEPSWERPPVFRPELIELSDGRPDLKVVRETADETFRRQMKAVDENERQARLKAHGTWISDLSHPSNEGWKP